MMRLGSVLKNARGKESRAQFARKLELSYTFVRAMEHGLRFPSDKVLLDIADRLGENADELLLAAYCDRSPLLAEVLEARGVTIPPVGVEPIVTIDRNSHALQEAIRDEATEIPATKAITIQSPF
ncbi:MAG: helix-turn-helix transcriptional regulator [bacterium]|nr:XRE family transcriptional regulator [Planctomycetota bacterium]HIL52446.1 XRE family transcriptional regulator [Planctomycetota bacterium]